MNGEQRANLVVELKEHFERILDERENRYNERFVAAEKAVTTALAAAEKAVAAALSAQEKLTTAAFVSSEKAITKAEEAQRDAMSKTNEFRAQLSDQAETLMPRKETAALIDALNVKIAELKEGPIDRLLAFQNNILGRMAVFAAVTSLMGGLIGAVAASFINK